MNNQFEYIDQEKGTVCIVQFLSPSEKNLIHFTCRYLTSPPNVPPIYSSLIEYNKDKIFWDSAKIESAWFLSDNLKKNIQKVLKLKVWW